MDVKSFVILNCFCLLTAYFNIFVEGDFPDVFYGVCVDPKCSVPISKGHTILHYSSPDDSRLSFGPNEEVLIFVKEYGPKKDLWGVVAKGIRGYISRNFIRETQVFERRVVPAIFEFKTSILVSNSFTVNSHLHVSSHSHQSDSILNNEVPQSISHTVQHNFISSSPSTLQQEWASHSENFEASHLSPSLNPTENLHYNSHSRFGQSSQLYSVSAESSHLHLESGNILSSSHMIGVNSEHIVPSSTHMPPVIHSPRQSPPNDPMLASSNFENSINNVPHLDYPHGGNFDPISASPSESFENIKQYPSISQQQQVQSSHVPEMHSSYSGGYLDDDMSKTYAMLSNMGFDNTGMYVNQELDIQQPSPAVEKDLNNAEYNAIPSQSHYPSVQGSDTSFYSSGNLNPQHTEENIAGSSDIPKEMIYTSNKPSENIALNSDIPERTVYNSNKPSENIAIENEQDFENMVNEENIEENNFESKVLATSNDVPNSNEEILNTLQSDDLTQDSEDIYSNNDFNLQSSMGSNQLNQHTSQRYRHVSSSEEDSVIDSSLIDTPLNEHTTSVQLEEYISSSEFVPLDTKIVQEKSKIFGDTRNSHLTIQSDVLESSVDRQIQSSDTLNLTENNIDVFSDTDNSVVNKNSEVVTEALPNKDVFSNMQDRNNDALFTESSAYYKEHTAPQINDFFVESGQNYDVNKIMNTIDIDGMGEDLATYQGRNLKGEFGVTEEQQSDSDGGNDENITQFETDSYSSFKNWFDALRSVVDSIISWIPEPLYSALMDLQSKGISPRVPVFTTLCGFTCILLIVPIFYVKERSKESRLSAQLANVEKNAYTLSATNTVLEEKLETLQTELATLQKSLAKEKNATQSLKIEFENHSGDLENTKAELENCLDAIDALKEKENEYLNLINDYEKEKEYYVEHKESLDKIMKDQENTITNLTDQLQESGIRIKDLEKEKEQFFQLKADYEEKLAQFDRNCNQLLQEAEVWNLRVKELTEEVNEGQVVKDELMATLKTKDEEIESLKELVETFKEFDEIEDPEEQAKNKEDKLQFLLNNAMIANQLKKEEEKNKLLDEQLGKEKNKILDMEVELLEAKSEIDKLKISYNQSLQDKAEAQTKLDVLTNYFKDKEIQLQRQLGAQEAVRQKKEEDANSAERRICLIEQENASYKSQVASMKQEMEETERTLRNQIAAQEKKAHENWIAARAAERKLEDMKQEVTQLRQRLTLLEREQENWANASRDEIIRPVPKRMQGMNDESGSQDLNTSERGMFPHPSFHDRLPLVPPMMLPPDGPLPPLPPPPMPPFLPPMDRFRPQPWHMQPDHSSEYRTTPPEFMAARESTPPRGRQSAIIDGDTAPNTSSPLTTDTRDSRNSTPPHLLPDFHDVPPQPGRPFFPPPPPLGRPRFPMHQQFRRDAGPDPKRLDNPNEYNSRGPQQPPPPEQWQHSRV